MSNKEAQICWAGQLRADSAGGSLVDLERMSNKASHQVTGNGQDFDLVYHIIGA